ncbi:hypothetical protein ACWCOV_10195 [Kribbella sp. NPDC002412]
MHVNPVLDADWPDPDALRVGDDYRLFAAASQGTMDGGGAVFGPVRVTERETA